MGSLFAGSYETPNVAFRLLLNGRRMWLWGSVPKPKVLWCFSLKSRKSVAYSRAIENFEEEGVRLEQPSSYHHCNNYYNWIKSYQRNLSTAWSWGYQPPIFHVLPQKSKSKSPTQLQITLIHTVLSHSPPFPWTRQLKPTMADYAKRPEVTVSTMVSLTKVLFHCLQHAPDRTRTSS